MAFPKTTPSGVLVRVTYTTRWNLRGRLLHQREMGEGGGLGRSNRVRRPGKWTWFLTNPASSVSWEQKADPASLKPGAHLLMPSNTLTLQDLPGILPCTSHPYIVFQDPPPPPCSPRVLAHLPHHGSPHPLTLRRTLEHWRKDVTGHAEEKQMVSWSLHRCHLQAPGVWLDGNKGCDSHPPPYTDSFQIF